MEEQSEQKLANIRDEENLIFMGQMLYSSKLAVANGFVKENGWNHFVGVWKNYQNKVDLIIYQPLLKSLLEML
jgi:hypothetical protein